MAKNCMDPMGGQTTGKPKASAGKGPASKEGRIGKNTSPPKDNATRTRSPN